MTWVRTPVALLGCASIVFAACHSPAKPSPSFASASPLSPPTGAQLSYYSQPVTLHASGGVITSGAPLNYVFEIATDDGFSKIVATKTVSPGANADVAVILDQLTASADYFWRVRTVAADHGELVSKTFKFTIGPPLTIAAPVPVETLDGAYQHNRPTLTVTNAARTGPVS